MADEPAIEREDAPDRGRYVIRLAGGLEAELTYRRPAPGIIAIDHTYTPPEFRGQNIAARLMLQSVADARREGTRIEPICSYAVAQFRRHPDWADLLA